MSDDIPQDQVEAVARAICQSRTCEGFNCCQWPAQTGRRQCPVRDGGYEDAAIAAIRVLTPLIAAVERERCAMLVRRATASESFYDDDPVNVAFTDAFNSGSARTSVSNRIDAAGRALCADIRSVKGAVGE